MKKIIVVLMTVAVATLGFAGTSLAFHEGGVATCDGCHTMHNSKGGSVMTFEFNQFETGPFLLQSQTASGACLNCHESSRGGSYHISSAGIGNGDGLAPLNYTPGGDFTWVRKNFSAPVTWLSPQSGDTHGHNIVAPAFDYNAEASSEMSTAPGGAYPNANLACSSCHDPHGKYRQTLTGIENGATLGTTHLPIATSGSYGAEPTATHAVGTYRLLAGVGYQPASTPGFPFLVDPPIAVSPVAYNRSEAFGDTRVAYGQGMSEFCGNCHAGLVENAYVSGATGHTHPAGNSAALGAGIAANYNAYVESGDLTGTSADAFTSLVPYEAGTGIIADLVALQATANGPDATDNVMCLSCHRAHASAYGSMTRWDSDYEFITEAGAFVTAYTLSPAEQSAALYERSPAVFAEDQRNLCNKCHVKD